MSALAAIPARVAIPPSAAEAVPRWCVLRTGGPRTLGLAASLQSAGFDAWTPIERIVRRKPRSKVVDHLAAPLTPTYVFVTERHLSELLRLEGKGAPHPFFSVLRLYGAIVLLEHTALHPLRAQAQAAYLSTLPERRPLRRRGSGNPYTRGELIKLTSGAFAGLQGMVQDSDGVSTTVTLTLFGRSAGVKMSTSQMRADSVATARSAA